MCVGLPGRSRPTCLPADLGAPLSPWGDMPSRLARTLLLQGLSVLSTHHAEAKRQVKGKVIQLRLNKLHVKSSATTTYKGNWSSSHLPNAFHFKWGRRRDWEEVWKGLCALGRQRGCGNPNPCAGTCPRCICKTDKSVSPTIYPVRPGPCTERVVGRAK